MAKSKRFEPVSRPLSDIPVSHPERDALLRAIVDNSSDDTPRLVYADWQEENGQPEHAQLLRVQCELNRLDTSTAAGKSRRQSLQYKERKLLASMAHLWPTAICQSSTLPPRTNRGLFEGAQICLSSDWRGDRCQEYSYRWVPQKNVPAPQIPFDRLRELWLAIYPSGVGHLSALRDARWVTWVEWLHLCNCHIGPGAFAGLTTNPYFDRLEYILAFEASVDSDELVRIVEKGLAGRLRWVHLSRTTVTTGRRTGHTPGTLAAALTKIAALPQIARLEDLELTDAPVDRAAVAALLKARGFANLNQLRLTQAKFRVADREALTQHFGDRLWWS